MIEILEKKQGESAREYAIRVLIYNIINVNLAPGERIHEADLSKALNMSRTPLREAVLELTLKQLIYTYPQRGTYISFIEPRMVDEVRYLRYVLESDLAVMACEMKTKERLDLLRENLAMQKYYNGKNGNKSLELDNKFHSIIYDMCDKNYLYQVVESVSPHFDRFRKLSYDLHPNTELIDDHELILEAIEKGDKEMARMISQKHLNRTITEMPILEKEYASYYMKKVMK